MAASHSLAALRPGVALGDYPEQTPPEPGTLARVGDRLAGLRRLRAPELQPARLNAFVAAVDTAADRLTVADGDFAAAALRLRRRLARDGLTDELAALCFALVRDAAADRLGLRHYATQILAGRIMLCGGLAEMETGEGKTLAATLPVCTAALAGIPVHVVTANDYLVTRDAAAMGPLYRALGLSVGAITETSTPAARRTAYARDITYNTSKQLAFDYLRDRIAMGPRRGSVRRRIRLRTVAAKDDPGSLLMRGLCFAIVDEADSVLIDEARTPFVIARERETKLLAEQCAAALAFAGSLDRDQDVVLDRRRGRTTLAASGKAALAAANPFPDQPRRMQIALAEQALTALLLFVRDRDYLVRDGRVQIIDPNTGRVMPDRSWNRGLHQMIETKEGCELTAPRDPLARLTFQRFFRRYLRLAGMTGTAREVRGELWTTYRLPVVRVDTHRPSRRRRLPVRSFSDAQRKWAAIVARTNELHAAGRPVLIGTRTVAESETLSALLDEAGLRHRLLNARQDGDEARIVAAAGQSGQITVATNMAGRGTDIALGEGVAARGGLHVIVAERNDARRLDRQLLGRCGRHGDPGSYEFFQCADDKLIDEWIAPLWQNLFCRFGPGFMLSTFLRLAQNRCERRHRNERRDLSIMQDKLERLLSFSGAPE